MSFVGSGEQGTAKCPIQQLRSLAITKKSQVSSHMDLVKKTNYPGKRPQTVYYKGFMCR